MYKFLQYLYFFQLFPIFISNVLIFVNENTITQLL